MDKASIAAWTLATLAWAPLAQAADPAEDLLQKSGCTTCHGIDKKIVGPAYKDVAAKYKGDKAAEARLIDKVKKGGTGAWGQVPMPPNPQVKDEDIATMVRFILKL
jgi:cytochrome c